MIFASFSKVFWASRAEFRADGGSRSWNYNGGDHDIRTLDMHYRGLTSREEAVRFYAMRPTASEGNSTAIGRWYLHKWRAQQELNLQPLVP